MDTADIPDDTKPSPRPHLVAIQAGLLPLLIAVFALVAALAATGPRDARIATQDIRVIEAAYKDTRRPNMADPDIRLDRQVGTFSDAPRQFHLIRPTRDLTASDSWIWVPSLGGPTTAYLNNVPIGQSQSHELAGFGLGRHRLLLRQTETLFLDGLNRIDLRMDSDPARAGAGPIYIGPGADILPRAQQARRLRGALHVIGIASAALAALSLLVIVITRGPVWAALSFCVAALGTLLLTLPAIETWLLSAFGADEGTALRLSPPALIVLGFGIATLSKRFRHSPTLLGLSCLGGFAGMLALAQILLPVWSPAFEPLALWTITTAFLALAALSVMAVLSVIQRVTLTFSEAQTRLTAQAALISAQERELEASIRRSAVLAERQRFTRDMHDGIGGQLTSLLIRLRSGRADMQTIEHDLQSGLADIRNIVDSLDHVGDDLDTAFVTFRARAEQQVRAAGMDFVWHQPDSLTDLTLNTREVLHTYRFMQEALTNAMRHSGGECVTISVKSPRPGRVDVIVADDGQGYDPKEVRAGKGTQSLRERADKLGGRYEVQTAPGEGTRVSLTLDR